MAEYIEREAMIERINREMECCNSGFTYNILKFLRNSLPSSADVVEVVHGRWVDRWGGKYANPHYECSECEISAPYRCDHDVLARVLWVQDLTDYCPHCGAKMESEE